MDQRRAKKKNPLQANPEKNRPKKRCGPFQVRADILTHVSTNRAGAAKSEQIQPSHILAKSRPFLRSSFERRSFQWRLLLLFTFFRGTPSPPAAPFAASRPGPKRTSPPCRCGWWGRPSAPSAPSASETPALEPLRKKAPPKTLECCRVLAKRPPCSESTGGGVPPLFCWAGQKQTWVLRKIPSGSEDAKKAPGFPEIPSFFWGKSSGGSGPTAPA